MNIMISYVYSRIYIYIVSIYTPTIINQHGFSSHCSHDMQAPPMGVDIPIGDRRPIGVRKPMGVRRPQSFSYHSVELNKIHQNQVSYPSTIKCGNGKCHHLRMFSQRTKPSFGSGMFRDFPMPRLIAGGYIRYIWVS